MIEEHSRFKIRNCMEEIVWQYIDQVLESYDGLCKCERCKYDIFALALNNVASRYVVTDLGETYTKIQMLDHHFRAEIFTVISIATGIVKNNPRHSREHEKQ
jgi:competence protein ComFB